MSDANNTSISRQNPLMHAYLELLDRAESIDRRRQAAEDFVIRLSGLCARLLVSYADREALRKEYKEITKDWLDEMKAQAETINVR